MTQDNSASNQPTDPQQPGDVPPVPAKPKKKKRWLILKIAGALVVLLIVLILFAPTIASMGFVREAVVDKVNAGVVNGKLEIDS